MKIRIFFLITMFSILLLSFSFVSAGTSDDNFFIPILNFFRNLFSSTGIAGLTFDSSSVYVADYGRLECLKDQRAETFTSTLSKNLIYTCGDNYDVDFCEFEVSRHSEGINKLILFSDVQYQLCDLEGDNCGGVQDIQIKNYATLKLANLPAGKSYKFSSTVKSTRPSISVKLFFYPFRLYSIESGAKFISSSSDCCLANQNQLQKKKLLN